MRAFPDWHTRRRGSGTQAADCAGRVIAAGRNEELLRRAQELGADATVNLATSEDLPTAYREAAQGEIQVIVDYVCGPPTEAALQVASVGGRLVQIGEAAWQEIRLPALQLRSKSLTIFGYGNMSASFERRAAAYQHITKLAARGRLTVAVERIPLRQVTQAWERQRAVTASCLDLWSHSSCGEAPANWRQTLREIPGQVSRKVRQRAKEGNGHAKSDFLWQEV